MSSHTSPDPPSVVVVVVAVVVVGPGGGAVVGAAVVVVISLYRIFTPKGAGGAPEAPGVLRRRFSRQCAAKKRAPGRPGEAFGANPREGWLRRGAGEGAPGRPGRPLG